MRPRPVVGEATVPDAVRRLLDKFDYPDRETPAQVVPILPTLGAGGGSGAYIHLTRAATQSIASGGEAISWDTLGVQGVSGFTETVPTTTVTIKQAGYYNIAVQLGWSSFTEGGTITVLKNGLIVWPPADDPGLWSATDGQLFEGTAHSIGCAAGDTLSVNVNPDDASAQTLASATFTAYLVDRFTPGLWELVFTVDNHGVTWDSGRESWWTTDATDDINPALFERDLGGAVLNSYAGYDNGSADRNRSLVYLAGFLWGIGNEEVVHKVNPATGASVSSWTTGASGLNVTGIGSDGTNLFVIERDDDEIREFNQAGALQNTDTFPTGHDPLDITWDGSHWWATTSTQTIIKMSTSFAVVDQTEGPPGVNLGCHYLDGFLYVMTASGLYRKAV